MGNRGDQAVADLGDGLNDVWRSRIVGKGSSQFGDCSDEDIFTHENIGPDGAAKLFAVYDFSRGGSQGDQHLHDLRFEVNGRTVALHCIDARMNDPLTDPEIALHWEASSGL